MGENSAPADFRQIVDTLNQGLIVLDRDLRVVFWNRWMTQHTRTDAAGVMGRPVTDVFPGLEARGFLWKVEHVFKLGTFAFFSQRLHDYIFEMRPARHLGTGFDHMKQNVIVAPLRGESGKVELAAVSIVDETDAVVIRDRLEEVTRKLEETSRTDYLTRLPNRRHLFERLGEELNRHRRQGTPLSLALVDADHFKMVNDTYGHLAGDDVLVQLAGILKQLLRPYDFVGRYGGEEFCLVLPDCGLDEAARILERLRSTVAAHRFVHEEVAIAVTISAGLVSSPCWPPEGIAVERLLNRVDQALYAAKNGGRNRVVTSQVCRPEAPPAAPS